MVYFKYGRRLFIFLYCALKTIFSEVILFSSRSNLVTIKHNKYFNSSIYNISGPAGKVYRVHSEVIHPMFSFLYLVAKKANNQY